MYHSFSGVGASEDLLLAVLEGRCLELTIFHSEEEDGEESEVGVGAGESDVLELVEGAGGAVVGGDNMDKGCEKGLSLTSVTAPSTDETSGQEIAEVVVVVELMSGGTEAADEERVGREGRETAAIREDGEDVVVAGDVEEGGSEAALG